MTLPGLDTLMTSIRQEREPEHPLLAWLWGLIPAEASGPPVRRLGLALRAAANEGLRVEVCPCCGAERIVMGRR